MKGSDRPVRKDGFLTQELDDEVVLYNPARSEALCLNATAALIWGLCDGETTVDEIQRMMSEAFPDAPGISQDVLDALDILQGNDSVSLACTT
ncbi:MAG: PqqD family peptide modification chaperone [Rhodobiaceae bacterium]|nr:PqqD family peptide modification chaperone [Rhodobiaceae bacterium]MCC0053110.1 PqqD family peptide modification chaperone [Rhodobiaceae bacterium]